MKIKVLLADDHRIMRDALRAMLEHVPDIEIVGEAANGQEVLDCLAATKADIVVMDLEMPAMNGVDTAKRIRYLYRQVKVVALSAHWDKRHVQQMLEAGVSSYIVKTAAGTELLHAIRAVNNNQRHFCQEAASALAEIIRDRRSGSSATLGLREIEVLTLLAQGVPSSEIAMRMNISGSTVETHRRNIMRKLGLHSVVDLVRYALREGLVEL